MLLVLYLICLLFVISFSFLGLIICFIYVLFVDILLLLYPENGQGMVTHPSARPCGCLPSGMVTHPSVCHGGCCLITGVGCLLILLLIEWLISLFIYYSFLFYLVVY